MKTTKLLFICTHNRCRSILSEAISNHYGQGQIEAKSAGSQPCGEVHPLSLKYLNEAGIDTQGLSSQSWDEFEDYAPDVVITVCDSAAKETCPVWFGQHIQLHWGLSDPSKVRGNEQEKAAAFSQCIQSITARTQALLALNLHQLTQEQQTAALNKLV